MGRASDGSTAALSFAGWGFGRNARWGRCETGALTGCRWGRIVAEWGSGGPNRSLNYLHPAGGLGHWCDRGELTIGRWSPRSEHGLQHLWLGVQSCWRIEPELHVACRYADRRGSLLSVLVPGCRWPRGSRFDDDLAIGPAVAKRDRGVHAAAMSRCHWPKRCSARPFPRDRRTRSDQLAPESRNRSDQLGVKQARMSFRIPRIRRPIFRNLRRTRSQ